VATQTAQCSSQMSNLYIKGLKVYPRKKKTMPQEKDVYSVEIAYLIAENVAE
jgi:hypothetical protein